MSDCIAVLNAGSSSIKFAIYRAGSGEAPQALFHGKVEKIGLTPHLAVADAAGKTMTQRDWPAGVLDHAGATKAILETAMELLQGTRVRAIGHRVVHGGADFAAPVRVDDAVLAALARFIPLAPLHQPHNLAPIRAIAEAAPQIAQIACFDTAFHQSQAPVVRSFGLPRELTAAGIRRYGFHGLSFEFIVTRLRETAPDLAAKRLVIAHLGNGASLCAVHEGRSVAATTGFTAVDGLMMGTRCGTLDPGVLVYLMDEYKMDARAIEDLIYRRSGLLGVSGLSPDMRALRGSTAPEAKEAIELFVHRIIREIGSLAAALGGLDGLVFTAGIGENDAATRAEVCAGCGWLGVSLDPARNAAGADRVSTDASPVAVRVVPTDEESMIARHTMRTLATQMLGQTLGIAAG